MMHFIKTWPSIRPKIQERERVNQLTSDKYGISHPIPIPALEEIAIDVRDISLVREVIALAGPSETTILFYPILYKEYWSRGYIRIIPGPVITAAACTIVP